jgi:hypothetical protein
LFLRRQPCRNGPPGQIAGPSSGPRIPRRCESCHGADRLHIRLVLGLLVSSEYTAYDRQNGEIKALSANLILLDRTLGFYGPDAKAARDGLRDNVRQSLDRIWSPEGARPENLNSTEMQNAIKGNIVEIESLSPKTDVERLLQSRALQESETMSQARLLMFEQLGSSIPWPFLTVLVFWIAMLFLGFGLLSRRNGTVTAALLLGAISVAGALFLILELGDPYHGIMRISEEPLRNALTQIDR